MTGRQGRWAWGLVLGLCALAADAHADNKAEKKADKKKDPGFFDPRSWVPGSGVDREAVHKLTPRGMNLAPAAAPGGPTRIIRLRVYADSDYRGMVIRWQSKTRTQVQRINSVVGSVFNVRFEIESLRDWDRSHVGVPLGQSLLEELRALEPANDVDLVLGLVTPLRGVATSVHSIGWAAYLSRHMLLRGMDDEQEFRFIEHEFTAITAEERQSLYAERKAHKEIVIFLHEWGHTLGLLHHEDPKIIMNPAYDQLQAEFSEYEKRFLMLVLGRRLAARDAPYPESADLLPVVEAMPTDEGSDADRAQLRELVRSRAQQVARPAAGTPVAPDNAVDLSTPDVNAFNHAVEAFKAGRTEDAWKALAPVVEHARARKVGATTWLRLSDLAAALGALTEADDAAGRAGTSAATQKIAAAIESTRHRIALPLDSAKLGVPREREPAYVAGYWQTAKLVDAQDVAGARARLGELASAFPDAPGIEVLTCDLELHAKHVALAVKHCEAALAKFKGATRAHVLLAAIAFRANHAAVGEQHLRQAILLDPSDPSAWQMLGQFYRSTHASKRLADLANEHQTLLSSPLPE